MNINSFLYICLHMVVSVKSFKWYDVKIEHNVDNWVELRSNESLKMENLSKEYLSYSREELKFDFPFYGSKITSIAVTTQGFISMHGEAYVKIFETQYISPLMANFNSNVYNGKAKHDIRIHRDSKKFIVQWSEMLTQELYPRTDAWFTFQCHLYEGGKIIFLYKNVSIPVTEMSDEIHPIAVGISGGYKTRIDDSVYWKEFDTVRIDRSKVKSSTSFTFIPRPNCMEQISCETCKNLSHHCNWCPTIQKCSTGHDGFAVQFNRSSCHLLSMSKCDLVTPAFMVTSTSSSETHKVADKTAESKKTENKTDDEEEKKPKTDMTVIKVLLITTGTIVLLLNIATILICKFGWRRSHYKYECKGTEHTLIKAEEPV